MWKRIQTLYLAIAAILIGSLFFCNICKAVSPQGEVAIGLHEKVPYLLFNIMVFTATVITTLSYRTRMLQVRVAMISALLLFGFQVWIGIDWVRYQLIAGTMIYTLPSIFPLIAAILILMAAKRIMDDESIAQTAFIVDKLNAKREKREAVREKGRSQD